jgi:flavin reductase (DIM6/NTAB) family NADH-FMN oxidoreductase RutF
MVPAAASSGHRPESLPAVNSSSSSRKDWTSSRRRIEWAPRVSAAMNEIDLKHLSLRPFQLLDDEWALLVSGIERPNPMTVSWGGFGTLWNRPTATVYVRPTRHTFTCLEQSAEFTLNFLPRSERRALDVCGELSGRDHDKWHLASIEPEPAARVRTPRVAGATLVLECRVMASFDFLPERFLDPSLSDMYPIRDYHRVFLGEVLGVWTAAERDGDRA